MCKVDHDALRRALPPDYLPCDLSVRDEIHAPQTTTPSLLCDLDQAEMDRLAATVLKASDNVAKNRISLITNDDYWHMNRRVLHPAYELDIPYGYVLHLLSLYAVHKGIEWLSLIHI